MEDPKLLTLAFIISTIGLFLIVIFSQSQAPVRISGIGPDHIGRTALLKGVISDVKESREGHLFFVLSDGNSNLKAVAFQDVSLDRSCIVEGKTVLVKGMIDEYKDELEIIIRRAADLQCP